MFFDNSDKNNKKRIRKEGKFFEWVLGINVGVFVGDFYFCFVQSAVFWEMTIGLIDIPYRSIYGCDERIEHVYGGDMSFTGSIYL